MYEFNDVIGSDLGAFRLLEIMGIYHTGAFIEAEDREHAGHHVALRFITRPSATSFQIFRDQWLQRAHILEQWQHPHVLPLSGCGVDESRELVYFIMYYCSGGTLLDRLDGSQMDLPTIHHLVEVLADALDDMHAHGVVHLNLKPSNILFDNNGQVYIADYGIADLYNTQMEMMEANDQRSLTTPEYMSPEQLRSRDVGLSSDLYAFGVIIYQLVTGHLPYVATLLPQILFQIATGTPTSPRRYRPDISPELEAVLLRALEKDPAARYATARDFARAFGQAYQMNSQIHMSGEENPPAGDETTTVSMNRPEELNTSSGSSGRRWQRRYMPIVLPGIIVLLLFVLGITEMGGALMHRHPQNGTGLTAKSTTLPLSTVSSTVVPETTTPGSLLTPTTPPTSYLTATATSQTIVLPLPTATPKSPLGNASLPSTNWSMFGFDLGHTNYNPVVVNGTPSQQWSRQFGDQIWGQPIVVNGTIYFGSFDGNLHAVDLATGNERWHRFLGQHPTNSCGWYTVSQTGSPVYVNGEVYAAGGDGSLHALNSATGNEDWSVQLENISTGEYIWGSLTQYHNNIYAGIASFTDDCPQQLAVGQVIQINLATRTVIRHYIASPGCFGGGIWSTPTIDASANVVYVTTGNIMPNIPSSCDISQMQAIVALNASDLSLLAIWRVPQSDLNNNDSDFGGTPTLFTTSNGMHLVGAVNKNGYYYAIDTANVYEGKLSLVWKYQVADGGTDPQGGQGSIATAAFDGHYLYVAGGRISSNGLSCSGSIEAVLPDSGTRMWARCLGATVLGAVTVSANDVFVTDGNRLDAFAANSGDSTFSYTNNNLYAGVTTIANHLVTGDRSGYLTLYSW